MTKRANAKIVARDGGGCRRFYFHHRAGNCVGLDLKGRELDSALEALSIAYLLVLEKVRLLREPGAATSHSVEVTDAAGRRHFDLAFSAVVGVGTPSAGSLEPGLSATRLG